MVENLINDLASLGIPMKVKASINTDKGTFYKEIDYVSADKKIEKRLMKEFNKEVKVLEYVRGVTYYFYKKSKQNTLSPTIGSSSLEELWEMFKADRTNQPIPERKCKFIKYNFKSD